MIIFYSIEINMIFYITNFSILAKNHKLFKILNEKHDINNDKNSKQKFCKF